MKKITLIFAALLIGAATLSAQNAFVGGHRAWTFALQGGPMYSVNENGFSYRENGYGGKLFSLQGSAAIGFEFTEALGLRLSVAYGDNRSAANTRQTAAHGFYPYNFRSVNGFLDGTLDLNGNYAVERAFRPRLYAGIGVGHTFHFTKPTGYGTPSRRTMSAGKRPTRSTPGRTSVRKTPYSVSVPALSRNMTSASRSASSQISAAKPTTTSTTACSRPRKTRAPIRATPVSRSTCAPCFLSASFSASIPRNKRRL